MGSPVTGSSRSMTKGASTRATGSSPQRERYIPRRVSPSASRDSDVAAFQRTRLAAVSESRSAVKMALACARVGVRPWIRSPCHQATALWTADPSTSAVETNSGSIPYTYEKAYFRGQIEYAVSCDAEV